MESQQKLFKRFIKNQCNTEEVKELLAQFSAGENEILVRQIIIKYLEDEDISAIKNLPDINEKQDLIYSALSLRIIKNKAHKLWPRMIAAACVLFFIAVGVYFVLHKASTKQQIAQNQYHDISPARNEATLTLSNGKKIALTKGLTGVLTYQGNTTIKISTANTIAYTSGTVDLKTEYNTLSTQKGEQSPYALLLADGSKVWLNAASSITFPTAFNGKDRVVKITGEAYFEVAHKINQPFSVLVKGQTIQDIGTHFNINAYDDEPSIKTTLLQGSIKIFNLNKSAILKPGQQSATFQNSNNIFVNEVEADDAIAWKNGRFNFDRADIPTVMREFARWYGVEVKYDGNIPVRAFSGNINRNLRASSALQILSALDVHFKIKGNSIIVQP